MVYWMYDKCYDCMLYSLSLSLLLSGLLARAVPVASCMTFHVYCMYILYLNNLIVNSHLQNDGKAMEQ